MGLNMWNRGVFLSETIIKYKAHNEQAKRGHGVQAVGQNCKFSNVSIQRFKMRHNFQAFKSHGEIGDADDAEARAAKPEL